MLTAIRKSDLRKVIGYETEKDNTQTYICDYCENEVIHHRSKSQVKIGHFKHKAYSNCANNQSESEEHVLTKKDIRDYLLENYSKAFKIVELEKWICNKSIRPDVYIETKKGTKIAIEVQASQLTIDQLINRTKKYHQNNIYVMWVLIWPNSKASNTDYIYRKCYLSYNCDNNCDHSLKLTEMELVIHWMNFKSLIYWDYMHEYYNGFYVVELDKFVGESSEYYSSEGEHQYFDGRVAKNKKIILDFNFVSFKNFVPKSIPEFQISNKSYSVPERKQMTLKKSKT